MVSEGRGQSLGTKTTYALLGVLAFLSLGGLWGGLAMLIKPDGSMLQTSLSLLEHAPVKDFFWPGVFLLVFMSFWPALNIYGLLTGKQWARSSITLLGFVTMAWIVYESFIIRTFSPLQPIIFTVGLVLIILSKQHKEV